MDNIFQPFTINLYIFCAFQIDFYLPIKNYIGKQISKIIINLTSTYEILLIKLRLIY